MLLYGKVKRRSGGWRSGARSREYEKICNAIGNCDIPIKYKNNFVALKFGENIKNSYVYVLDEKFGEIIKFKIGTTER